MTATAVVLAVLMLLAGLAAGWFAARVRTAQQTHDVQDAARERAAAELAAAQQRAGAALAAAQADTYAARESAARLEAALETERTSHTAQLRAREADWATAEARLRESFAALAADALERNTRALDERAEARLSTVRASADGELAQRQQAIEGMVAPLREALERVTAQVSSVEKERSGSYAQLLEQVSTMRTTSEQLRRDTNQLVTALRAPQVRGRWGEMQLERVVEAAGMREHIDYETQQTVASADGVLRPDLVVHLVGGKNIVVDSKVAFSAYLEAMDAQDESVKAARFKAHARHLRDHIDALGAKAYYEHFSPSPEFVVCFVPADTFLDAALQQDATLLERAFDRNVVVATPSTLVALLRTVAYTWRQEALAANAAQVNQLGRELYQRLSKMGEHVDKLGRSIGSVVNTYNSTVASLESRVFVTARKMADLKVVDPQDALVVPSQVTDTTRTVQVQEFADQRLVSLPKSRVPAGQGELLPGDGVQPGRRATS